MPFERHQEKKYAQDAPSVYQAALKTTERLSGVLVSSSAEKLCLEVKFPKTVLGKLLGERTFLLCEVRPEADGALVILDAYPLDALERKLMFGARQGVTQTVVVWFTAHLENNLEILGAGSQSH